MNISLRENSMNITMTSPIYIVTNIKKNTKSLFLCDVEIGNELSFSVPVRRVGRGDHGGTYATYISVSNITKNKVGKYSFNQISHIFDIIEIEPRKELYGDLYE